MLQALVLFLSLPLSPAASAADIPLDFPVRVTVDIPKPADADALEAVERSWAQLYGFTADERYQPHEKNGYLRVMGRVPAGYLSAFSHDRRASPATTLPLGDYPFDDMIGAEHRYVMYVRLPDAELPAFLERVGAEYGPIQPRANLGNDLKILVMTAALTREQLLSFSELPEVESLGLDQGQ